MDGMRRNLPSAWGRGECGPFWSMPAVKETGSGLSSWEAAHLCPVLGQSHFPELLRILVGLLPLTYHQPPPSLSHAMLAPFHLLPNPSSYPGGRTGALYKPLASVACWLSDLGEKDREGVLKNPCSNTPESPWPECVLPTSQYTRFITPGQAACRDTRRAARTGGGKVGGLSCTLPLLVEFSPYLLLETS